MWLALDTATDRASIAVGMPGEAPASLPSWSLPPSPADSYVPPLSANSFQIGTYVGGELGSLPFDEQTMIGFSTNLEGVQEAGRNYYPLQLSMRAPDIAAADRDPLELPAETTIAVEIPTDLLEIR